jgi:hypothetical protein
LTSTTYASENSIHTRNDAYVLMGYLSIYSSPASSYKKTTGA